MTAGIPLIRTTLRYLLSAFFVFAGTMHFVATPAYVSVVPSYLPNARLLVAISGVCEILGGIAILLPPPLRRVAGWGLILLLFAVFPANIEIALHGATFGHTRVSQFWGWVRLPFQALMIYWVWWCAIAAEGV